MSYFFVIIFYFCFVPVPLQRIYVLSKTKEINLSNSVVIAIRINQISQGMQLQTIQTYINNWV